MAKPIPVIQTRLKLLFTKAGKDVTQSLMPDLISFSYDDKESGEADEISITLKDETGKWAGTWKPEGGEHIRAFILPGTIEKAEKTLPCGKFFVDQLSASGGSSGRIVTIGAVSIPLDKPCRRKTKSKAWEKIKLKDIAGEIAKESGMALFWDSDENPQYDRIDQKRESDLKFLCRLCEDAGLSLKVTDSKIVIFDQSRYEGKKAIMTIIPGESNLKDWSFSSSQSETYRTCEVKYYDTKADSVNTYTYVDPNVSDDGQEYQIKTRVVSLAEAKQAAKKKLRKLNARKITGSMTLAGNILLSSGSVIACKGFGSFDGNFIVEKASHKLDSGGYITSVDLRRVNSNY